MTDSNDHMGYSEQEYLEHLEIERERIDVIRAECDEYGHDWQPRQTDKQCRRCGFVSDFDVNDIPF